MDIVLIALFFSSVGLFIGSFLNVLVDRLPNGEDVISGRSHCDFCKKNLAWYELIPVVSFVLQGGKCRNCKKKLSWQYPAMEVVTAILYGLISWYFFPMHILLGIGALILSSALLVTFVADIKYFIIPDSMILVGLLGGLIYFAGSSGEFFVLRTIVGIITCALFFLLWLITHKRGIGFGDVKFAFLLGFILGFPQVITALYIAFLTGAAVGIILILGGKKKLKSRVPFGPFLIIGFVGSLFISIPKLLGLL